MVEAYPEGNMRATIVRIEPDQDSNIDPDQQVWKITFDYSKFDSHNQNFESANYYGVSSKGQDRTPTYTARETGWYTPVENIYMAAPNAQGQKLWDPYFKILAAEKSKLAELYASESQDMTYVDWLESKILN